MGISLLNHAGQYLLGNTHTTRAAPGNNLREFGGNNWEQHNTEFPASGKPPRRQLTQDAHGDPYLVIRSTGSTPDDSGLGHLTYENGRYVGGTNGMINNNKQGHQDQQGG